MNMQALRYRYGPCLAGVAATILCALPLLLLPAPQAATVGFILLGGCILFGFLQVIMMIRERPVLRIVNTPEARRVEEELGIRGHVEAVSKDRVVSSVALCIAALAYSVTVDGTFLSPMLPMGVGALIWCHAGARLHLSLNHRTLEHWSRKLASDKSEAP